MICLEGQCHTIFCPNGKERLGLFWVVILGCRSVVWVVGLGCVLCFSFFNHFQAVVLLLKVSFQKVMYKLNSRSRCSPLHGHSLDILPILYVVCERMPYDNCEWCIPQYCTWTVDDDALYSIGSPEKLVRRYIQKMHRQVHSLLVSISIGSARSIGNGSHLKCPHASTAALCSVSFVRYSTHRISGTAYKQTCFRNWFVRRWIVTGTMQCMENSSMSLLQEKAWHFLKLSFPYNHSIAWKSISSQSNVEVGIVVLGLSHFQPWHCYYRIVTTIVMFITHLLKVYLKWDAVSNSDSHAV